MKIIFNITAWIIVLFIFRYTAQETRKLSQTNKFVHEIIMATDFIAFQQNGGGAFGYNNYYKWTYVKWRAKPERTVFEKIMFWNIGIFYEASNPPKEYKYPFLL